MLLGLGAAALGVWVAFSPFDNPITNRFFGDDVDSLLDVLNSSVDTTEVPGDPGAFEPYAAYPQVRAYAGPGAELVEIEVSLVRADGTLDLEATYSPKPDVTYTFVRVVPRPANAPPPGATGTSSDEWHERVTVRAYEPGQRRQRTEQKGNVRTTVQYTNKGMERDADEPSSQPVTTIPAPACDIREFWKAAIAAGAPSDGVARVRYDEDGYRFTVSGYGVNLAFDAGCVLRQ